MGYWTTNPAKLKQYLMLLADAVVIVFAYSVAVVVRAVLSEQSPMEIASRTGIAWPTGLLGLYLLSFFVFNLYDLNEKFRKDRGLITITLAVFVAAVVTASLLFFSVPSKEHRFAIGRTVFLTHIPMVWAGTFLWRSLYLNSLLIARHSRRLALLGHDRSFDQFVAGLEWFPVREYEFVGMVCEGDIPSGEWTKPGLVICLRDQTLGDVVRHERIDCLVCSIDSGLSDLLLRQALALRRTGIEVYDLPSFYSHLFGKIPVFSINTSWVLQTVWHANRVRWFVNLGRLIEIIGAAFLLLVASPLLLLIAVAIKIDSAGPVFFVQERLGLYEVPFQVYKFRTMIQNAESETGPKWAEANDPRVTALGRLIRKTRLDEIPQLINILKGDMAFVGFRPIRRHFADILAEQIPFYSMRFAIKPGLTGWPQVQQEYSGSIEEHVEKFEYELFYLANRSFVLDLFILLKTIQVVIFGRGQ
jgi:exopolysaccharide biosynthesis polyprenyl glycosylphosphotransferase